MAVQADEFPPARLRPSGLRKRFSPRHLRSPPRTQLILPRTLCPIASNMSAPKTTTSCLYQPLNIENREIRLVTIISEPSLSSSMECKLSTFGLVDAPSYIALSYVWGDIRKTTPITVDDAEIHVTTNLLAALRRMSAWDHGTYFWIDALCINQSNTEEKGHQVSIMRNIYQQAMFVTMWLGVEQDDSNLAMSMIEAWEEHTIIPTRTWTAKVESRLHLPCSMTLSTKQLGKHQPFSPAALLEENLDSPGSRSLSASTHSLWRCGLRVRLLLVRYHTVGKCDPARSNKSGHRASANDYHK
jgi:Heterokaryon incompatibility protein (HET)